MPKKLEIEKKTIAISMLCEGNSIRGVERMTGIHRDTIMRLAVRVGNGMKRVQSELFTKLDIPFIEVDEVWGFVGAKKKTVKRQKLSSEYGDIWTWVALDADTKLVPSWHVGGRSGPDADAFIGDLEIRLVNPRPQISSDAYHLYKWSIQKYFRDSVDHASIIKTFKEVMWTLILKKKRKKTGEKRDRNHQETTLKLS